MKRDRETDCRLGELMPTRLKKDRSGKIQPKDCYLNLLPQKGTDKDMEKDKAAWGRHQA